MTEELLPAVRSSQVVFTGRVFRIERDELTLSNGVSTTLDIVRHRGSVVLVPQPTRDSIILIRQYRHAIGRWIWEVPAGTLEAGEEPESAAKRECEEEIGLTPGVLTRLGAYYPTPGFCDELMVLYRAEALSHPANPAAGDVDEQIAPRTFSLIDARALVQHGEVCDLKTVLALSLI